MGFPGAVLSCSATCKHAPLKITMTHMENKYDWNWIRDEIKCMYELMHDETLPLILRQSIKRDLIEIKQEIGKAVLELP